MRDVNMKLTHSARSLDGRVTNIVYPIDLQVLKVADQTHWAKIFHRSLDTLLLESKERMYAHVRYLQILGKKTSSKSKASKILGLIFLYEKRFTEEYLFVPYMNTICLVISSKALTILELKTFFYK